MGSAEDIAKSILESSDLPIEKVRVKEWGQTVGIRVLTVGERDSYEREWIGKKEQGIENFRAKYLARCLCHPDSGERLFTDDQITELSRKSSRVIGRLFDIAIRHNAMSNEDVEELAKN